MKKSDAKRHKHRSVLLPEVKPKAAAGYLALTACMALLNFALPQREPLSFALFFAALSCGLSPFICGGGYLLASAAALSAEATLSCAIQASFLILAFCIYRRLNRTMGAERAVYAAFAQAPFVFLYPNTGYALIPLSPVWTKAVIAVFLFLLSVLFDGGLHALLFRAFRCRLPAGQLAELCTVWLFVGLGTVNAFGQNVFYGVSLFLLLSAVLLMRNASAVPFALVLSLPLCIARQSAAPCAEYAAFACFPLLLAPYGRSAAALSMCLAFLAAQYFEGLYDQSVRDVILTLTACALPAVVCICIPERICKKAKNSLLFYRERTLPRIAINRNRRAVGEQLYEVSALFREIENAFGAGEKREDTSGYIRSNLINSLCANCPNRRRCEDAHVYESLDKLIAVGCAKGRVNLIDLPADLSSLCGNSAGLMFALNKQLAEYRRCADELDAARAGRKLLAEQAHGVSEILREIALEQSEEYVFSDEENALSNALAEAGILSSEIFLYGEGTNFTVTMTVASNVSGKILSEVAGEALGVSLSLAEKIPLTSDRACFVLRRKANFDAAFGIASRAKAGVSASGDTHSILKIDERRFLVALSDGMGSGEEAREVSDHTLSLLESFYKAKMPSETVLNTVNRLIAFSAEEMFACLDLAAVNLDTGAADIVKIGSPVGFILSGDELRVLEGESLPMGMLEAVHPATMRVNMKEDDFLLFMSDGVTSAFGSSADLCAYLSGLKPLNPQALSEEILEEALRLYGGTAEDDMTVLAVRLMKAA